MVDDLACYPWEGTCCMFDACLESINDVLNVGPVAQWKTERYLGV